MNAKLRSLGERISLTRVAVAALVAASAFGALTAQKSAKIDGAVQQQEFYDTAKAIRSAQREEEGRRIRTDSTMLAILRRLDQSDCEKRGYPLPWCRDYLPSATQAGSTGRP